MLDCLDEGMLIGKPVSVTFLGSGDAFGSGGRFQTCLLLDGVNCRSLIDCGASSLVAMKQRGIAPATVDAILVTHLHGDHFGGIPFFILDAQFSRRETPLILAGPPGLEARVWQAMEVLFPNSSNAPRRFAIEFVELGAEVPHRVGRLEVTAYPVIHACGAPPYAIRVECDGRIIAYSGDTEWTDKLVEVADQADLFICEAYFFEKKVKFHLDYQTLLSHRPVLRCKRLLLTHMSSDMLAHITDLSIECAHDGFAIML